MSASVHARLFLIGLWTEAFDDGVFEWKPLTLKARLFPVDNIDLPGLLDEVEGLGFVRRFSANGKAYGAIRNFRRFQRPKSPNSSKVLTEEMAEFVGYSGTTTEELPKSSPSDSEKSPQMEDGGGREEEEEQKNQQRSPTIRDPGRAALVDDGILEDLADAAGIPLSQAPKDLAPIRDLVDKGYSLAEQILPTIRAKRGKEFSSWRYVVAAVVERAERSAGVKPAPGRPTAAAGAWVDEGSPAWEAVTKARGKPPLKTWHNGKPGAFVRLSEIPAERAA
ncbi:hypothetical protein ABEG18_13125 [Alsobacter sp. KACC 23698]|uniref:DUF1376 domain-containing protein n=1 Tax=Alsobacter sp. KACC 23698 TaxID=3149229 RepID=A0AAU7J968_9HYPH